MGSGKSTLGRKIASSMGLQFIDLDVEVEREAGETISEIFATHGEATFRRLESEALRRISVQENIVISTGGGTPCQGENMEFMNARGITVYLKMQPEAIAHRLLRAREQRPLIAGKSPEELIDFIKKSLVEREPTYNKARVTIDNPSRDGIQLINALEYYQNSK